MPTKYPSSANRSRHSIFPRTACPDRIMLGSCYIIRNKKHQKIYSFQSTTLIFYASSQIPDDTGHGRCHRYTFWICMFAVCYSRGKCVKQRGSTYSFLVYFLNFIALMVIYSSYIEWKRAIHTMSED